jgi:hypothetical protein
MAAKLPTTRASTADPNFTHCHWFNSALKSAPSPPTSPIFDKKTQSPTRLTGAPHPSRHNIEFSVTLEETRQLHKLARKELCGLQSKHTKLRKTELSAKTDAATQTNQPTVTKALRQINKQEEGRRTYRILDIMKRKSGDQPTLDRLEIPQSWPDPLTTVDSVQQLEDPKQCTQWQTVTDPVALEYYLLLRNRLYFGQAQGTPFMTDPLSSDLDSAASTPQADEVLAGTYTTNVGILQCTALLQACKATANLDTIPAELTMVGFHGKIKAWKETTSTSPSGSHLGRYKALFGKNKYDRNEEEYMYIKLL